MTERRKLTSNFLAGCGLHESAHGGPHFCSSLKQDLRSEPKHVSLSRKAVTLVPNRLAYRKTKLMAQRSLCTFENVLSSSQNISALVAAHSSNV